MYKNIFEEDRLQSLSQKVQIIRFAILDPDNSAQYPSSLRV